MAQDDYGKYILVPIDFADYSIKAAYLAFELAEEWGSEIVFLHTFTNETSKKESIEQTKKLNALFKSERMGGSFNHVTYSVVIKRGVPEDEIKRFIKNSHPRIIIMGTRTNDQKDDELIGSVTSEVLTFMPAPMIVVPDSSSVLSYNSVKSICYATNFSSNDAGVFNDLMQRLQRYDFNVHFVHVLEPGEAPAMMQADVAAFQNFVEENFPQIEKRFVMLPCREDVPKTLFKYVKDNDIDIITVKMSSGKGLYNMFVVSLAQQLVYLAQNPLLVLPYATPKDDARGKHSETVRKMLSEHRNLAKINLFNRKRV